MIKKSKKGFTIVELLIVIAIIGVLAAIVFVVISKTRVKARNVQRKSDVSTITDSIYHYSLDNQEQLDLLIDDNPKIIGGDVTGCNVACEFSSNEGSFVDDDQADFDTGTYSSTQWDGGNSWVELTAAGQASGNGSYTSVIEDAGGITQWSSIDWTPSSPFGKELPNNGVSETAYSNGNADMNGNVLLMHMNESSGAIIDSSGNGNDGVNNGATYGVDGKFNSALSFNGGGNYMNISNDVSLNPSDEISLETWVKWNIDPSTGSHWAQIFNKNNDHQYQIQHNYANSGFEFAINTTSGRVYTVGSTAPIQNVWYHVIATYNGSNMYLYVNGGLDGSRTHSGTIIPTTSDLVIAKRNWNDRHFNGSIDEISVYNRALTSTEVLDRYKRGALRLKHQVRSCDDAVCTGEGFIGPDGTNATYYSELNNSSAELPSVPLTNVLDNQYFQYQSVFETDNVSYTPELMTSTINYSGDTSSETTEEACVDLASYLTPDYVRTIPIDPTDGDSGMTNYAVKRTITGGVEVVACSPEDGKDIRKSY